MTEIQYYFTVLSPFTYLAGSKLETIAARHGASIAYKPMDIMRVFAETGGTAPKDRHPSRNTYRLQELRRIAQRMELPINQKPAHWPTNPMPASCALIAAQDAGFAIGLAAHGLMKACWAEEKDIAQDAVIAEVLTANGVAPSAIEPHLEAAAAKYEANTVEAIEKGVFGSPFYIVGEEVFFGQDRLDYLDTHLAETAA